MELLLYLCNKLSEYFNKDFLLIIGIYRFNYEFKKKI